MTWSPDVLHSAVSHSRQLLAMSHVSAAQLVCFGEGLQPGQ